MLRFLYRGLIYDRSRILLSVLAIAAAIVLVVVLEGFKVGLWQQIEAYPQHLQVQLIGTQAGVTGMTGARSVLPADTLESVEGIPGVQKVSPLVGSPVVFSQGDRKTPIYIIGYEDVGGPWRLQAGRNVTAPGELVMDYGLARKYNLDIGEQTELLGKDFQIVGLSAETSSMFNPYVFIDLEDAMAFLSVSEISQQADGGSFSFLLIEVQPGVEVFQVRKAIEAAVPVVDVTTPDELAANDVAVAKGLIGSIIGLLVGVAYVVGILVIGLTLYASVFERLREYGIMKAIGARNSRLYQYVLGQALVFAGAGVALGFLVSLGVAALMTWLAPQYLVVAWDGEVLLRSGIAATIMALAASVIPIRQVAGVDPATVFRQ